MIARAIARDLAASLGLALVAGASLVTLFQTVRLGPIAAAAHADGLTWLTAIGLSFLLALPAVAPAAFALAMVLTALRWEAAGELLAARAAGLGPAGLWSGALRVAALTSILLALLSVVAGPWATARLERSFLTLLPAAIAGAVRPGALVEVTPGVLVYAGARHPSGALSDLVVSADDAVLAARTADLAVVPGPRLVVNATRGVVRRGPVEVAFDRVTMPIDLSGPVAEALARLPGASASPFGRGRRAAAPFSFLATAALLCALALEQAGRPGRLVLLAIGTVVAREVLIRAGEGLQVSLGPHLGAWLPVLVLGPAALLGCAVLGHRRAPR